MASVFIILIVSSVFPPFLLLLHFDHLFFYEVGCIGHRSTRGFSQDEQRIILYFLSTFDIIQFEDDGHWLFLLDDSSPLFVVSFVLRRCCGLFQSTCKRIGQSRDNQITS
jgi:hypothetical protein